MLIEMNILNGYSGEGTSILIEDGKQRLQQLLGHSSLNTTLIYLQVSETPHTPDFSPLDMWENKPRP